MNNVISKLIIITAIAFIGYIGFKYVKYLSYIKLVDSVDLHQLSKNYTSYHYRIQINEEPYNIDDFLKSKLYSKSANSYDIDPPNPIMLTQ